MLVRSWWLNTGASERLLERTAAILRRAQRRNAAARVSHRKSTRAKLRAMGIRLTKLKRCRLFKKLALKY